MMRFDILTLCLLAIYISSSSASFSKPSEYQDIGNTISLKSSKFHVLETDPTAQPSKMPTHVPSPAPTPQYLTAFPTVAPGQTASPTNSPVSPSVSVITYYAQVDLSYTVVTSASSLRKSMVTLLADDDSIYPTVTLTSAEQLTIRETFAYCLNISSSYVTFSNAGKISSTSIFVKVSVSVPLSGPFDGQTSSAVFTTLSSTLSTSVSSGLFTNVLNQAATANGVTTLQSSVASSAESKDLSTAVYTSFNDDDSLSVTSDEVTAIVVCGSFGLGLFYAIFAFMKSRKESAAPNVSAKESSAELIPKQQSQEEKPEDNVRTEDIYKTKSIIVNESPQHPSGEEHTSA